MNSVLENELKKMGVIARTENKTILSNPILMPEACPDVTGEPINDWIAKVEAWESGWTVADAALSKANLHLTMPEFAGTQNLRGMFGEVKRTVSIEEMNAAIAETGARAGC